MAKGIYPSMSPQDVINALGGWGLSVSQEQLIRPTPDFVEGVYCACLRQVTDITHESLRDPTQNALSASSVDEKDLYASALASNILMFHLTRLAQAARVDDFCSSDISHPSRERTLLLLSAFINFVKFTEQLCEPFVRGLRERSEVLLTERDQVTEQLSALQQKIDATKAKIAEDEPRCEQLRKENSTLRARMFATKEFQTAAAQEVEKLKAEKHGLLRRKEALNGEITSVSDSISRTRTRIVQSPERIKRTITTMSTTAADDKRTVAIHEAKARDLQTKINALLTIEKDVRGCVEQLQTIEKEVRSLQESQKELVELRDHLDDKKIERNELHLRLERVEKQQSNAQEKLERAQRHAEDKKAASQRAIDRLQTEYNEMAVERRDNDKQVEGLRSEADVVQAKMAEHIRTSESELNELLAEYWKLRHVTDVYMETLANKLNMRVSAE